MFNRECCPDSLKVYDVANSTCKLSISPTETRPDFYAENNAMPAILGIELDKDGVAQCMLEDVKANCAVKNIYVNIANQDNQIILVVYHNILDALADCICKYDVRFKMSKLAITMETNDLNSTLHVCLVSNETLTKVVCLTSLLQNLSLEVAKS